MKPLGNNEDQNRKGLYIFLILILEENKHEMDI